MRKQTRRWLIAAAAVCLLAVFAVPRLFSLPVVGEIRGAENEIIEVDGVQYVRTMERPYTANDRGRYLGSVRNGNISMRVYEVKGDRSDQWLFARWEWEGYFYCRVHGAWTS